MLSLLRSKKAQSTMEYALLFATIIAAFTAMQIYTRRGMQYRLKSGIDKLPEVIAKASDNADNAKAVLGVGEDTVSQYEPYYLVKGEYNMTTTSVEGTERGTITQDGGIRELTGAGNSRSGTQEIKGTDEAD